MIVYSNNEIKEVHYSGYTIDKIYACNGELVYSASTPSYGNKLVLTYSNSDVYTLECTSQTDDLQEGDTTPDGKDYHEVVSAAIGDCVTYVSPMSFYTFSSMTSVYIPDSVTIIGQYAFTQCKSLSSVTLPSTITNLGKGAFKHCTSLTEFVIPSGVTRINDEVLEYDTNMQSITVLATTPPRLIGTERIIEGEIVTTYSHFDQTNDCPIYVPNPELYKVAEGWSKYESRFQAIT